MMTRPWLAELARDRMCARLALQIAAVSTGVPVEAMQRTARLSGRACRARWLAMYLAHVGFGWSLERVGYAFGMNRTTAAAACRWAEDGRDRPIVDALLERLERCVRELLEAPPCDLQR